MTVFNLNSDKMKKYYFIYYSCCRINRPENFPVNSQTTFHQATTDIHPLSWQIDCNEKYDKEQPLGNGTYSENYKVISWETLTKAEFELYVGIIN